MYTYAIIYYHILFHTFSYFFDIIYPKSFGFNYGSSPIGPIGNAVVWFRPIPASNSPRNVEDLQRFTVSLKVVIPGVVLFKRQFFWYD